MLGPLLAPLALLQFPPTVVVDRDDVEITKSCNVSVAPGFIVDDEGDGVVHVVGDDIVVNFLGAKLRGAAADTPPDRYAGVGIVVTGKGAAVRNAQVSGFRVGIRVAGADGVLVDNCNVADNFHQRLRSTPAAEDVADWLAPHSNDEDEWIERYGAGIWAEECSELTVKRCLALRGQNGLVLDGVTDSRVFDNNFSFLSGWGIALWRSSRNTISRNACDFCIRGYSHGIYNRGQDSAGILLFEQCSENLIVENSATHCGDGFFGFAGQEALEGGGEARGNNGNLLLRNDFSYAAAHGIEMTFSFDNAFIENTLTGNAICGVWGGYSQRSLFARNTIERNGDRGYGLERGGINIEHGSDNLILDNLFRDNECGVHLWWDEDPHLVDTPWAKANGVASENNVIARNSFRGDAVAVHLRACGDTCVRDNAMENVAEELDADGPVDACPAPLDPTRAPVVETYGELRPIGARARLRGRENILMTEWGPYDWASPRLRRVAGQPAGEHAYELLGRFALRSTDADLVGAELVESGRRRVVLRAQEPGTVARYELRGETDGGPVRAAGAIVAAEWLVTVFGWETDPREDAGAWRAEAEGAPSFPAAALALGYGMAGPSELAGLPAEVAAAQLGGDRFGTLASTTLRIPAGAWRIRTTSDDGIRVWANDRLVVDDWTHHGPTRNDGELQLDEEAEVQLRVEHFELDGFATLSVELEAAED